MLQLRDVRWILPSVIVALRLTRGSLSVSLGSRLARLRGFVDYFQTP
jgi:hypothetical protein